MATPSATGPAEREKAPSGRLLLRMPPELHAKLARAAESQGTSLNGFITRALSARVGFGDEENAAAAAARQDRSRLVLAALVANAIVIGLAAVAAIGILVLAWRG